MKGLAILALVAAGCAWGVGFPLGKLSLREMQPAHMVLIRLTVGALAGAPFALANSESRALFRSPAIVLGGVLYGAAFLLQFEGLARVSVAVAALLIGLMPALIAFFARVTGEKQTRLSWAGVVGATLGAALIAGRPGGASTPLGIALSLASLLVFIGWLFLAKHGQNSAKPMAITAVTIIVSALTVLPFTLLMHGPPNLHLSLAAWAGVVGQGLISTLLATAAWQYGSSRVGSATSGVFINIEPVLGAALGVLLFGDQINPGLIAGGAMILVGSVVVVMGERRLPASVLSADVPATPV